MNKFAGTRYASMWDSSTWLMLLFVLVVGGWPIFLEPSLLTIIIVIVLLLFVLLTLLGIYYRIDGNSLVVYTFFIPTAYPIDKIAEIKSTKSILSAPATSITHRLAIKFTDRKVLRSFMPLVISPARPQEFIAHLIAINPAIKN